MNKTICDIKEEITDILRIIHTGVYDVVTLSVLCNKLLMIAVDLLTHLNQITEKYTELMTEYTDYKLKHKHSKN